MVDWKKHNTDVLDAGFEDEDEEYMTSDRFADLTEPGIYDWEPDEPGMDYGPEDDDFD